MYASNPPHWTQNSCLCASHSVWVHFGPFCYCMKLGAKWAELVQWMQVHATKSRQMFSQWTHPIHPHWTPNSSFVAFHSVWVHLGPFRCCMKLGANQVELVQLMQKFVQWSHVGIFRNEGTRSYHWILNSCFSAFHSVWVHLGPFRCYMKLGAKWA